MCSNKQQEGVTCWQCRTSLDSTADIFCNCCGAVQAVDRAVDHFSRLGIEVSFDQDRNVIEQAYFSCQRCLHPDRFVGKTEKERSLSLEQSTAINEAYETLKDPLRRAQYILSLQGIIVNHDGGQGVKPDGELLEGVMRLRIQLDNIVSQQELCEFETGIIEDKTLLTEGIRVSLQNSRYDIAAQQTIRLQYTEKLIEEIGRKRSNISE